MEKAVDFIKIQMKEKTYLGHDGIFVTEEEYSEFVRTEIVVNAAAHRDYGIKGTDIQIKMFDDRLEVDSPGTFAGMVKKRIYAIRISQETRRLLLFLRTMVMLRNMARVWIVCAGSWKLSVYQIRYSITAPSSSKRRL